MKTFEESMKSQKTVASMIENKKEDPKSNKKKGKGGILKSTVPLKYGLYSWSVCLVKVK